MPQRENHPSSGDFGLDQLVDGIWEESTRLETVLVVHGYDSLREALARTLEHYGYRTLEASSREQALRAVRADRPAAILLDLALGDKEGTLLASELASRTESREIPVLALASDAPSADTLRTHGIREALVMPVEQKDLLAALDRVLEPARSRPGAILRLEPADEQCRLPLEDRLSAEHLSLFFRFAASLRVELRQGSEMLIRGVSARLTALGIRPEIQMEGSNLVLRYELSIADALSLETEDPAAELFASLCESYAELATRPEALHRRIAELQSEYRRLQRLAS